MSRKKWSIYMPVKRVLDVVFSALLLVLLSPVLLVVTLLVLAKMGRPAIFVQPRPGLNGTLFKLYKFRTMESSDKGEVEAVLSDGERLTKLGILLRKFSLDELPELWNIFKGDMSFVGPRPLLVEYLPAYTPEQARRHEVRPGLTGLAQVSGRNLLAWDDRFKLDVYYVDNISPWLDLKILVKTVETVFSRQGISGQDSATVEPFVKR